MMHFNTFSSIIHVSIAYYIVSKCFVRKLNPSLVKGTAEADKSTSNLEVMMSSAFVLLVL